MLSVLKHIVTSVAEAEFGAICECKGGHCDQSHAGINETTATRNRTNNQQRYHIQHNQKFSPAKNIKIHRLAFMG
jgi:hypothetical protein